MPGPGEEESKADRLISETVIPGLEYADHDFMTAEGLKRSVAGRRVQRAGLVITKGRSKIEELLGMEESYDWKGNRVIIDSIMGRTPSAGGS
jgi:hypothetical protein